MTRRPTDPGGGAEKSRFRADVEGLRAVAIVLVVASHAGIARLSGGYVGVDVFFVISGFLITGLLVDELTRTGQLSMPRFWARRVRRLLPASTLVVLVTLLASWQWLSPLRTRDIVGDAEASAVYGITYRLAVRGTDYFAIDLPPSPLQHLWSLAVEEQFYLVWPLLLVLVTAVASRRGGSATRRAYALALGVLAAGSIALSWWLTGRSAPWAYFSLWTRAWELAAGGLVALSVGRLTRMPTPAAAVLGWCGLAAVAVAAVRFGATTPFPGLAALLPVGGAAAVIAAGCSGPTAGPVRLLGLAPAQVIGRLSYSWYLWHWPVLIIAPTVLGHALSTGEGLALGAGSLVPAWLSFVLLESPVRRSRALGLRPRRGLLLGLALALTTVLGAVLVLAALPSLTGSGPPVRRPPERLSTPAAVNLLDQAAVTRAVPADLAPALRRATVRARVYADGCHAAIKALAPLPARRCTFGDPKGSVRVVLFGDSHAAQWMPALDRAGRENGWQVVSVTKSGCPATETAVDLRGFTRVYRECDQWRRRAVGQIVGLRPDVVLLTSLRGYNQPRGKRPTPAGDWQRGTEAILRDLGPSGARLILLADTARPAGNVPQCVAAHLRDVRPCTQTRSRALLRPDEAAAEIRAVRSVGATRVDPVDWMCGRSRCPVIVGNLLVYRDESHLTTAYANWLAPRLVEAVSRVLDPR